MSAPPAGARAGPARLSRRCGGHRRFGAFGLIPVGTVAALLVEAADAGTRLADLLDHELRAALGTGLGNGTVPGDEVALGLRVVRAPEEDLAALRPFLRQVAAAVGLGAGHPQRKRAGGL